MTRPRRVRTGAGAIGGEAVARPPRRAPFVVLVVVVLLGALTVLLTLNTLSAADELEQQSIADSNAATKAQAQQLRVDLAAVQAPGALARAATDLGMVPADKPAFLRIGSDGSVTLLGVPGPVAPPPLALTPPSGAGTALIPGATDATVPAASPTSATATPTTTPAPSSTPTTPAAPAATPTGATPAGTATPTAPPAGSSPTAVVTLPGGAR